MGGGCAGGGTVGTFDAGDWLTMKPNPLAQFRRPPYDVNRTCRLVEIHRLRGEHSENCNDYFIDQGKNIELGNLAGYILRQYVLGQLTINEGATA